MNQHIEKKDITLLLMKNTDSVSELSMRKQRPIFLANLKPYMISADELREMMSLESDPDELLSYNPSVLIDFDTKTLFI